MKRLMAAGVLVGASLAGAMAGVGDDPVDAGLRAHEWGTFTSIAGIDGRAVSWQPAGGPSDLPCFVDSMIGNFKTTLRGTIRMETPVIYFYGAPGQEIDVEVAFPEGILTEWYPRAERAGGRIAWNGARLIPDPDPELPDEGEPSHYYAARATNALPVAVGDQQEKFLFYRGVGTFQPPLEARTGDGDTLVHLTNTSDMAIRDLILFENRSGEVSWRPVDRLGGGQSAALGGKSKSEWHTGMESLESALGSVLVDSGLYVEEAGAMVETWKDSWFEEGTRLFYILPDAFVDSILPLHIEPRPVETTRVFVGRMEILTEPTLRDVVVAVESGRLEALEPYGRFLEPILNQLVARAGLERGELDRAFAALRALTDQYATQARRCG
jgi:hypothetical protein